MRALVTDICRLSQSLYEKTRDMDMLLVATDGEGTPLPYMTLADLQAHYAAGGRGRLVLVPPEGATRGRGPEHKPHGESGTDGTDEESEARPGVETGPVREAP